MVCSRQQFHHSSGMWWSVTQLNCRHSPLMADGVLLPTLDRCLQSNKMSNHEALEDPERQYMHTHLTHAITVQIHQDTKMAEQPAGGRFKWCTIWTQITSVTDSHVKQPCYLSGTVLYDPRTKQHDNSSTTNTANSTQLRLYHSYVIQILLLGDFSQSFLSDVFSVSHCHCVCQLSQKRHDHNDENCTNTQLHITALNWITGSVVWLLAAAAGRLPQRAMLLILAMWASFAIMSLPMLRCFSFHCRFSRSSICIMRSWSASRRCASSNCRRACSRLALACSYKFTNRPASKTYKYAHVLFYIWINLALLSYINMCNLLFDLMHYEN